MSDKPESIYFCIDLKSFYASVECVERGLDPMTTDLVVADPERSKGTICLAITPSMKKKGIKNRCRLFEIPEGFTYITALPRMQLYIDYSARIYRIYLRYIAREDIHIYSIDECFFDATPYLTLYSLSGSELAAKIIDEVFKETGITATAGVGTNLYLAKIAMDILAKHNESHIAFLDEYSFREQLWSHQPLTDFWRIGSATAAKLGKYGICTMGDLAKVSLTNEDWLFSLFGIDAELMIDHAWGKETCKMSDIKSYHSREKSISSGQVLMRNYTKAEALIIVREMALELILDLSEKTLVTDSISLYISYDHKTGCPSAGGRCTFFSPTSNSAEITRGFVHIYEEIADEKAGIRRLNLCCTRVFEDLYRQADLFRDPEVDKKDRQILEAVLKVREKYGKNALLKATSLQSCANARERNRQIGGHHA